MKLKPDPAHRRVADHPRRLETFVKDFKYYPLIRMFPLRGQSRDLAI